MYLCIHVFMCDEIGAFRVQPYWYQYLLGISVQFGWEFTIEKVQKGIEEPNKT